MSSEFLEGLSRQNRSFRCLKTKSMTNKEESHCLMATWLIFLVAKKKCLIFASSPTPFPPSLPAAKRTRVKRKVQEKEVRNQLEISYSFPRIYTQMENTREDLKSLELPSFGSPFVDPLTNLSPGGSIRGARRWDRTKSWKRKRKLV